MSGTKSREKQKDQGMVRLDLSVDYYTYKLLLILSEKSGYKFKKAEKSQGFRGVISQAISNLYEQINMEDLDNDAILKMLELDSVEQQITILARKALVLYKDGKSYDEIAGLLNKVTSAPIKKKLKVKGKLSAKSVEELISSFAKQGIYPEDRLKNTPKLRAELREKGIKAKYFKIAKKQ